MERTTLTFDYNARTTYTAVKRMFNRAVNFSAVECNDELFVVEARRGSLLNPFSERIKIKVVATGVQSCRVEVASSSRTWLNWLNLGANSANVDNLRDYISNEVYKILPIERASEGATPQATASASERPSQSPSAAIRLVPPNIKFRP